MWFLKPKHTLESVAKELVEGLENGTLVLGVPEAEPAAGAAFGDVATKETPQQGIVLSIGDGNRAPQQLKEGDIVVHAKFFGSDMTVNGQEADQQRSEVDHFAAVSGRSPKQPEKDRENK